MSANNPIFRAGIIPFIINNDGIVEFMFMKPSNSKFGGPDWQIAKGRVEDDEDNIEAAIREGIEELGLRESNIVNIIELGVFLGRTSIFLCHINDKNKFDPFHWETGEIIWLSQSSFNLIGREIHKPIIKIAYDYVISNYSFYKQ